MNTIRFGKLLWLAPIALLVIAAQPPAKVRAQTGKSAAAASASYNIAKEIMDHKATLD